MIARMLGRLLLPAVLLFTFSVRAEEAGLQRYAIGDFTLESGEVVRDFDIAYMTEGTLNAAKSNAVLMVTAISGNHHRIDFLIGPGKGLDTDGIAAAEAIPDGRHVTIPSVQGHVAATPGYKAADLAFINATVAALMGDVTKRWSTVQ